LANPRLFGSEARIDWAHPVLALDELEQLVKEAPEQCPGRKLGHRDKHNLRKSGKVCKNGMFIMVYPIVPV
jgi:hypothetical protein